MTLLTLIALPLSGSYALDNAENPDYWANAIPSELIVMHEASLSKCALDETMFRLGATDVLKIRPQYSLYSIPAENASSCLEFVRGALAVKGVTYAEPNGYVYALYVPNDSLWPQQYGPPMTGADDFWDYYNADTSIKIAIVDEGTDYTHEDLTDRYGALVGYDIVNNDSDPMPPSGDQHGTHVSGIAAATMDNTVGIAGMAQAGLYSVMVLQYGGGSYGDVADGVRWAADNGADIINMSLGGSSGASVLETAVNYAYDTMGVLIAAASGNSSGTILYPARYAACIAVGSVGPDSSLSGFSCYGPEQELVAPGENVWSTIPNDGYASSGWSGTSMSTPHVAGAAALVWAKYPSLTNAEVRTYLQSSAIDLGAPGWDQYYGWGLVNLDLYVPVQERLPEPSPAVTVSTLEGGLLFTLAGGGQLSLTLYDPAGRLVHSGIATGRTTVSLKPGVYLWRAVAGETGFSGMAAVVR